MASTTLEKRKTSRGEYIEREHAPNMWALIDKEEDNWGSQQVANIARDPLEGKLREYIEREHAPNDDFAS